MDSSALLILAVLTAVVLIPFTRYCLVDSNQPNKPIPLGAFLSMHSLLCATGVFSFYAYETQSVYAEASMLLFMGMIVGASAVDPNNLERRPAESWVAYAARYIAERLRRVALQKAIVVLTALLAPLIVPKYWYLVLILLTLHLHYYKMANCITSEAGISQPQLAPSRIQRKWQIRAISAALVMGLALKLPVDYFRELDYIPSAWSYFGGYTLLTGLMVLASLFFRGSDT